MPKSAPQRANKQTLPKSAPQRASKQTLLTELHPSLRLRIGVGFAERFLNTMVVPLITVYLARQVGAALAGLLLLASVLVSAVAGLAAGYLAERYGRRRALIASAGLMTIGFATMAAGSVLPVSRAVAVLYAGYLIQTASGSFIQPVHDAVLLDVTSPDQRRLVYAFNYWSVNLALGVGAVTGTFLYAGHFTALLAGAAVVLAAATVLTFTCFAETAPPRAVSDRGSMRAMLARSYLAPLRDRGFLRVVLAMTVILGLEMQRTSGFIGVHIADQHRQLLLPHVPVTGIELLGIVQAANTVAIVLAAVFVERVLRGMSDAWRINVGIGLFAGCCIVLATASLAWVLLAAILLLTAGELMHIPAMQAVLARTVPDDARAGYMAVFNLNARGGAMIAALSLTAAPVLGPAGLALAYGLLGAAAIYLYAPLVRPGPAPAREPGTIRV